jgi:hypothetical protein
LSGERNPINHFAAVPASSRALIAAVAMPRRGTIAALNRGPPSSDTTGPATGAVHGAFVYIFGGAMTIPGGGG